MSNLSKGLRRYSVVLAATALLMATLAARQQPAQPPEQPGAVTPYTGFGGVVGRTAQDSTPSPLPIPHAAPGSPNIVYIVLDDVGFADLGAY